MRRIDFQPADVASLESKVLACAGERNLIRVLVIRRDNLRVLSPDLGGDQASCAKEVLADSSSAPVGPALRGARGRQLVQLLGQRVGVGVVVDAQLALGYA